MRTMAGMSPALAETVVNFPSGSLTERATVQSVTDRDGYRSVVTDRTPFHPVDHGWPDQGPDRGTVTNGAETAEVLDCVLGATDGAVLHLASSIPVPRGVPGWTFVVAHALDADALDITAGDEVTLTVDAAHRAALSAGHTGCHLAALALNNALAGRWRKPHRLEASDTPESECAEAALKAAG